MEITRQQYREAVINVCAEQAQRNVESGLTEQQAKLFMTAEIMICELVARRLFHDGPDHLPRPGGCVSVPDVMPVAVAQTLSERLESELEPRPEQKDFETHRCGVPECQFEHRGPKPYSGPVSDVSSVHVG